MDHFDSAGSGWPNDSGVIYDQGGWNTHWWRGYNTGDGHYRIRVDGGPAPDVWFWQPDALAPYRPPSDKYCVETNVWFKEPGFWGNSGLIFGANEANTDLYLLCLGDGRDEYGQPYLGWFVTRNSSYSFPHDVACNVDGKIAEGRDETDYNGWNRLQVGVDGNHVNVYVEGVHVGGWWMSGLAATTRVGLVAGDYEVSPVEARFDYFKVIPDASCTP